MWVDRGQLIAARNYAKTRKDRPAFALMSKLVSLVFPCDTLAASCGQGLMRKEGDDRPPLDKLKIAACKGSVMMIAKNTDKSFHHVHSR